MSHLPDFQIGVAGTGFIGPAHVEALHSLGITVAGIVGSGRERAAPKAEAMRLGKVYAAYND